MSIDRFIQSGELDLQSYSASRAWLGYFESNKIFSRREDAVFAIEELFKSFGEYLVSTSCYIIGGSRGLKETYDVVDSDIAEIVAPLLAADLIRSYDDYRDVEYLRDVSGSALSLVEKACLAMMDLDGLQGHLFLLSRPLGVLAYPHEDIGFGFFADSVESRRNGRKILSLFLSQRRWRGRLRTE